MMQKREPRVSIVIPVYNEADHLAACLEAIGRQTAKPSEVLVVDNNSTDNSVAIAETFDFVTILHEPKQGVVHARNRGFDAARGDVIGRIDADTIVGDNWIKTLEKLFRSGSLGAVSGAVTYYDMPWRGFLGRLDLHFRQWIADGMGREVFLFGSNMALRRSDWQQVRHTVCNIGGLHEDFDLAIHLFDQGSHVRFERDLEAAVSLRRLNIALKDYWSYVWLSPRTYSLHQRTAQRRMYPVVWLVLGAYLLIKLLYRTYDPRSDSLALRNIRLNQTSLRVNPATFVD